MAGKPDRTELERLLSAYIDGACSDAERQVVEAALKGDASLKALHAELTRVVDCVRSIGEEPAPGHLRERIVSQMERRALLSDGPGRGNGSRTAGRLVMVASAAVLVMAAGVGWLAYSIHMSGRERAALLADKGQGRPVHEGLDLSGGKTGADGKPAGLHAVPQQALGTDGRAGQTGGPERVVEEKLAEAAVAEEPTAGPVATPDEAYRQATAEALVARQVAAREIEAAEAAAQRAAERVALAEAAARQAEAVRAAMRSAPTSEPVFEAEMRMARGDGSAAMGKSDTSAAQAVESGNLIAAPAAMAGRGGEPRRLLHHVPSVAMMSTVGEGHVGALEVRAITNPLDRPAVAADAQMAVREVGGRLVYLGFGARSSTILAVVPAEKRLLLAELVTRIGTVREVTLHELAADTMSLEIEAVLTEPAVLWYPDPWSANLFGHGPHVDTVGTIEQGRDVPIRIVIRDMNDNSGATTQP